MSTRIDRISEEVMKALAEAMRSVKDPRVQEAMVSVVHCDVTNDLRYAKCYISVLGSEQQTRDVMKGLKSAAGWLRREVGHKIHQYIEYQGSHAECATADNGKHNVSRLRDTAESKEAFQVLLAQGKQIGDGDRGDDNPVKHLLPFGYHRGEYLDKYRH